MDLDAGVDFIFNFWPEGIPVEMFYLFEICLMLDRILTSEATSFNELLFPCEFSLFIAGLLNLATPYTGLPFLYPPAPLSIYPLLFIL